MIASLIVLAASPTFCGEAPLEGPPRSIGRPSKGSVSGAISLTERDGVQVLPVRHRRRCLTWATPRLVSALERAGAEVQRRVPDSPPLGIGNLGRARGGSLAPYSKSHQAGRDGDLSFYFRNESRPVPPDDLHHVGAGLRTDDGLTFDTARNWALVASLIEDESIDIEWLFVGEAIKAELLRYATEAKAPAATVRAAQALLHQPSDAPPHDDHFHLRIRCTAAERKSGCTD